MRKLVIACLALLSFHVHADSLSIVTLDRSYHYDRSQDYNETHNGVGIEAKLGEYHYGYLRYTNSFGDISHALYAHNGNLLIGVADGYDKGGTLNAGDDLQLLGGVIVDFYYVRLMITPVVATVGLVIPFE